MPKRKCAVFLPSLLFGKVRIEIPSVLILIKESQKVEKSQTITSGIVSKGKSIPETTPTPSNTALYPTSGGTIIIPNLAIGARRGRVVEEVIEFDYWGKVINGLDKKDSLTRENYPFCLIPLTNTPILRCYPFEGTVSGVSEPKLYHELGRLRKLEPEIKILKNVSLPIKNRNYGYKPDIAIVWKSKGICIDVEVDEPYDILSRKPIHYTDKECSDYLRNAYFLENGWYVIRVAEEQVIKRIEDVYTFVKRFIYAISKDERFNKTNRKIEPRKRWTREEAKEMAENNYREEYLELPPVIPQKIGGGDGEINGPDSFEFTRPKTDIVEGYYEELKERLRVESDKNQYLRIKRTDKGYEYITTKNQMEILFHSVKLYDVIENKEYELAYPDIDSFIGMEEIKIEKNEG